ncbi:MAG: sigma-54-dependent Fis family transcriptional regulator, partial [Desulfobacula sp.]|nr:sigma-54-dependent Fis family transcriptional regulator [Desulfobacula sp.]
ILLTGETGMGKDLIAQTIHDISHRRSAPFVKVNCSTFPQHLIESELFGHVKGAFTDAREDRTGKFETAGKGSLFLDEIANLSSALQSKILAALQNRTVIRLGSNMPIPIDVRLISATNADLSALIAEGRFREDLFYRLNTITIEVPPLRERGPDIELFARHFLQLYSEKYHKSELKISSEALKVFSEYHWPGNVRELMNTLERSVILSTGDFLSKDDIQIETNSSVKPEFEEITGQINVDEKTLYEVEKLTILKMLDKTGNNKSKTARRLGISRRTLHLKLKDYGVMP